VLLLTAALFPLPIAVLLSIGAGLLLTGAFHEDGLADYVDAAGGSMNRARMLEIMKDSRIGTYGTLALLLALSLKAASVFYLAANSFLYAAAVIVTAHALSRFAGVTVMFTQTYVRDDDAARAKPVAHALTRIDVATAAAFLVPAAALCWIASVPWQALIVGAAAAAAARIWLGRAFVRRLGGYTGDCLGAVQQASEIAFYLGVLAVSRLLS
jgi:adenosylcobinamide-GDP ribazoletransferase